MRHLSTRLVELMQIGKNMKDEQLKSVLDKIDINECEEIIEDYIL